MTLDYDKIIDAILAEDHSDIDEKPEGLQEYFLSGHTKDIRIIEAFEYSAEWLEKHTELKQFLDVKFTDWWLDQGDEDVFRSWLDGGVIHIHPSSGYLDTLINDLLITYRKRITETWTCEECGKGASEKHPYGHPDCLHRIGVPEGYPDGVPKDLPRDEVNYKNHIYCEACWRKLFLRKPPITRK